MGERVCKHCSEPVTELRLRIHPACRVAARKASQEANRDQMRRCGKCRKVKGPTMFSDDSTRATGKFPYCKECQVLLTTSNRLQDSEAEPNGHACPLCDTDIRGHANRRFCSAKCKDRVSSLRQKFGLTVEDYRAMVDATGGRCPMCKKRCFSWQVDHDHRTRRVTGVVCAACNVGLLAYSNHNLELAQSLVAYLFETPAEKLGIEALAPEGTTQPSQIHRMWGHRRKKTAS